MKFVRCWTGSSVRSELVYSSTASSVCQELFSIFFEVFLDSHPLCHRSLERSHILSKQKPFVNPFFRIFANYFIATISCVNSGRIPQHTAAPSAHAFSPIEPVTKCSPNVSAPSAQLPHGVLKISGTTRSSCARALAKSKLSSAKKPIRSAAETSGSSRSITSSTDKLWLTV